MVDSRVDIAASAELKQLGDIPIDDVLASIDGPSVSYRELYYRWEHQQWSAGDVDFSDDHLHWHEAFGPELRRSFLWFLAPFYVGAQQVTDALGPFVDAAPTEEQQVFLTTQLVDEARHTVFFDRFYAEVIGGEGADMQGRVDAQKPHLNDGFGKLLQDRLPAISRRIRDEGENLELLVEGIVLYHIVFAASLALTSSRFLLNFMREAELLPGFRQGFTAVARDMSRHVSFGVTFLKEMVAADERYAGVVRRTLGRLPDVSSIIEPPNGDASYWDPFPYSAKDLTTYALESLAKRLRAIDIPG